MSISLSISLISYFQEFRTDQFGLKLAVISVFEIAFATEEYRFGFETELILFGSLSVEYASSIIVFR